MRILIILALLVMPAAFVLAQGLGLGLGVSEFRRPLVSGGGGNVLLADTGSALLVSGGSKLLVQ